MAKNEPNKPDEIETAPPIEPAAEVVVSFDEINEILSERQAAAKDAEKAAEAPDKIPEEKAARRGRPPKADKADKEPKPEKSPKPPKAEKAVKPPPRKRKTRPRSRKSRPNRERPRARMNRNRLYISIFPSYTLSKIIRSKCGMMKKWPQWWKVSRTRV